MQTYTISGYEYEMPMDEKLDAIVQSSDPYTRRLVEEKLKRTIKGGGNRFGFTLSESELVELCRVYGEQFIADPCGDLDRYFDILNHRFSSRKISTQEKLLYLFGPGREYNPSISSLSAMGEAIAGAYMEEIRGFTPWVRPLGIMPDAVLYRQEAVDQSTLALAESKAAIVTSSAPKRPEDHLFREINKFLLDIQNRARFFRYHYEGDLVSTVFNDGGDVSLACVRVDLGYYQRTKVPLLGPRNATPLAALDEPRDRVRDMIRLQGVTCDGRDGFLTGLLRQEADRCAILALLGKSRSPLRSSDVHAYIEELAAELGLVGAWKAGEELTRKEKEKEERLIKTALKRCAPPEIAGPSEHVEPPHESDIKTPE